MELTAVYIYSFFNFIIILFQIALISGAPWSEFTMGGQDKGKLPKAKIHLVYLSIILLLFFEFSVLSYSDTFFQQFKHISKYSIWITLGFNTLTCIGNIITKSYKERLLWAPITTIMLVCLCIIIFT